MAEVELNERSGGGFPVTLPTFEGPLDLLLHLCQKHELDILDIPIGFVTEKYLEYLAVMQLLNLDVASEYLVMAATLAHIKSKMLLPAPPPGQEDDVAGEELDPREALIKRLLEYQKYKAASEELQSRGVAGRDVFLRGAPIEEAVHTGLPPLAQVPLFSLVEAFQSILEKSKVKLTHDIVHERITLADRINELVDLLRLKRRLTFEELFEGMTTTFDLVITFLALLEMTKLRMTRLFQADFNSHIYVEFCAQVTGDEVEEHQAELEAAAKKAGMETGHEGDEPSGSEPPDEDDSDKTLIDAAPPEIDGLLAPDDESARELREEEREGDPARMYPFSRGGPAGFGAEARDAEPRDAQYRDAQDRDAQDRDARDRDAQDRDARDRDARDRAAEARAEERAPISSVTAEFVIPVPKAAFPDVEEIGPDSEQMTRETAAPATDFAAQFEKDEPGTNKTSTTVPDDSASETDVLLSSLADDDPRLADSEPPMTDEEPGPVSQDVPPLDDGEGDA